ncbi:MAG TPA: sigma-70 family RNA polymerase sigma factor [Anaerolineales bacterium]|nr:sigma-70 family RNA polymerase sigma factor [Anaerolineales bacterium]
MDESRRRESISYPMKLRKSSIANDFESLFHEYWASINRLLTRMVVDPAEAEDLALETFFRLHQYRPAFGEEFNIRGWLHRVATNLALQSIRSFKRREGYELRAGKGALEEAPENQRQEIIDEQEDQRLARFALAHMNQRQAELLVMRYSGMSYKDIAAALNLSPTSIGPLLLRAEREFEQRYRALNREEEI